MLCFSLLESFIMFGLCFVFLLIRRLFFVIFFIKYLFVLELLEFELLECFELLFFEKLLFCFIIVMFWKKDLNGEEYIGDYGRLCKYLII